MSEDSPRRSWLSSGPPTSESVRTVPKSVGGCAYRLQGTIVILHFAIAFVAMWQGYCHSLLSIPLDTGQDLPPGVIMAYSSKFNHDWLC